MVRNGRRHVSRSAFGFRRRWVSTVRSDSFARSVASSASSILSLVSWFALVSLVRIFPSFYFVSFFPRFVSSRHVGGWFLVFSSVPAPHACFRTSSLHPLRWSTFHVARVGGAGSAILPWVRSASSSPPSLANRRRSLCSPALAHPSTVSVSVTVLNGCGCGCGWTGRQTHPPTQAG